MRRGWPVTELMLGTLVFAVLMDLFYVVEHWSEIDIDEHEEMTHKPEELTGRAEERHD